MLWKSAKCEFENVKLKAGIEKLEKNRTDTAVENAELWHKTRASGSKKDDDDVNNGKFDQIY